MMKLLNSRLRALLPALLLALPLTACGQLDAGAPAPPAEEDEEARVTLEDDEDHEDDEGSSRPPGGGAPGFGPERPGDEEPSGAGVSISSMSWLGSEDGHMLTFLAHLLGGHVGGVPLELVSVSVTNETGEPREVLVEAELIGYSRPTRRQVELAPGQTADLELTPTFEFGALYALTSAAQADIEVRVLEGGELVDLYGEGIRVDPLQRVRWFIEEAGEYIDMRPFVVGLITPEDQGHAIQKLLTEAAAYTSTGSIHGYQATTREGVHDQIRAVYQALQARGIVYTNVPGSFFDGAQYVKLPADALATQSANCVDGTLVFASALEAMGMHPILIFMTGHVFLGVWGDPEHTWLALVETTMIGYASYEDAAHAAIETFETLQRGDDPLFLAVDVVEVRQRGVIPVNR